MLLFLFQPADRQRSLAFSLSVAIPGGVLVRSGARFAARLFTGPAASLRLASFQVLAQGLGKPLLPFVALRACSLCGIIAHRGVA